MCLEKKQKNIHVTGFVHLMCYMSELSLSLPADSAD